MSTEIIQYALLFHRCHWPSSRSTLNFNTSMLAKVLKSSSHRSARRWAVFVCTTIDPLCRSDRLSIKVPHITLHLHKRKLLKAPTFCKALFALFSMSFCILTRTKTFCVVCNTYRKYWKYWNCLHVSRGWEDVSGNSGTSAMIYCCTAYFRTVQKLLIN